MDASHEGAEGAVYELVLLHQRATGEGRSPDPHLEVVAGTGRVRDGHTGAGERFRTIGVVEVRVPASTLLLFGMALMLKERWPLDLVGDRFSWGLLGARAYWLLHSPRPHFVGWDAEVANLYLGTPGARHAVRSGITASELRLRLGMRSPDYEMLRPVYDGAFFLAVELNSGFYTTVGD